MPVNGGFGKLIDKSNIKFHYKYKASVQKNRCLIFFRIIRLQYQFVNLKTF